MKIYNINALFSEIDYDYQNRQGRDQENQNNHQLSLRIQRLHGFQVACGLERDGAH